jgi:hypothetical protein
MPELTRRRYRERQGVPTYDFSGFLIYGGGLFAGVAIISPIIPKGTK